MTLGEKYVARFEKNAGLCLFMLVDLHMSDR